MSANSISFTPVLISATRGTHENATRERKPAREARARTMFAAKAVTYLGQLPLAARQALAQGKTISLFGQEVSQSKPGVLACSICSGVHGGLKREDLSGLITLYRVGDEKTGSVISLSDTCREEYLAPLVGKALTNEPIYRADFPKAKAR